MMSAQEGIGGRARRANAAVDGQAEDLACIGAANEYAINSQTRQYLSQHPCELKHLCTYATIQTTGSLLLPCCPARSDAAQIQSARQPGDTQVSGPTPNGQRVRSFPTSQQQAIGRWYAETASDQPWTPLRSREMPHAAATIRDEEPRQWQVVMQGFQGIEQSRAIPKHYMGAKL